MPAAGLGGTLSAPRHPARAAALLCAFAVACGAVTSGGSDVPFARLDRAQQIRFMQQRVVPALAPIFRAHDPKRYAVFGCETCHGENLDETYRMPTAALPALDAAQLPALVRREDLRWMTEQVTPAMARVLGVDGAGDAPPRGFGCGGCHLVTARPGGAPAR